MAATAWSFYDSFRDYLGNGDFDLNGTSVGFYMSLHTSAASANVNTASLSTYASIANEVGSGNGYTTGGASVTARTWAAGASAGSGWGGGRKSSFSIPSGGAMTSCPYVFTAN